MSSIRVLSCILIAAAAPGCEFGGSGELEGPKSCDDVPQCIAGAADPDPIHTCNAKFDAFDCIILEMSQAAQEPNPMIFKAQILQESSFEMFAVSPDSPCGPESGWEEKEAKSFGLMQLTPACGWLPEARLPDGHPNMSRDTESAEWATSVFNPTVNIGEGIRAVVENRAELVATFPDCTTTQYTRMALGAFNQGSRTVTGCDAMGVSAQRYVTSLSIHYESLSRSARWAMPL